jgi:hypothetical protein
MATQLKKTVKPSGGDYTSLEACMNANEQNLVTADKYFDVEIDGTWSSADTTQVTLHNYTLSVSCYINIYTTSTARHKGVLSTSYYFLDTISNYCFLCTQGTAFYTINGLQLRNDDYHAIETGGGSDGNRIYILNNLITVQNVTSGDYGIRINTSYSGGQYVYIFNNIIYGFDGLACIGIFEQWTNGTDYIYSNTVYGCKVGIQANGSGYVLKNNISYYNDLDYTGTPSSASTHNLSKDTTAPPINTYYISKTLTFNNAAGGDFHLVTTDTDAIDKGTNTSGESAPLNFTTDIDGDTRSGTWDIGADEYILAYPKYTKEDIVALPADDTDLSGTFSATDYTDVSSDNNAYVDQISNGKYALFLFKDQYTFQSNITITWIGKSDRAPSTSKVVLQIYDRDGTTWEDLDEENGVGAGTEFTLTGNITSDLDHYYDTDFVISCRVYQQAI